MSDPIEPSALAAGGATMGSPTATDEKQRGGVRRSPSSASQALADVLAIHARRNRRQQASHPRDHDGPTAEEVTTVTTVTTPGEWECQHEWTLRLGGWWGLLEAYCAKCGEVAERRAA